MRNKRNKGSEIPLSKKIIKYSNAQNVFEWIAHQDSTRLRQSL